MKHSQSLYAKLAAAAVVAFGIGGAPFAAHPVLAASPTATVSPLVDGNFEQGTSQSAWWERQGSGTELIDGWDPHGGTYSADLCDIDNCTDGHGNGGDVVAQTFTVPGQITAATLTYWYNVATSEPNNNSACHDWLKVGVGSGGIPDSHASKQYCSSTSQAYSQDSIDVTGYLQSLGGQSMQVIAAGFTDGVNPSEFLVDDVVLSVTYIITPSAPTNISSISNCSTGSATLSWAAPQFPLGSTWPVQSYAITPYNLNGVAQAATTVPASQTSLTVNLNGGTTCYFTVQATNANGAGVIGAPSNPAPAFSNLPASETSTGYTLSWSPQPYSTPAANYTVYVKDGSGPWLTWGSTTAQSMPVFGFKGHSYSYYVQAFSSSGATNGAPVAAMTTTAVAANATLATPFTSLYAVDAYGTLHHFSSPVLAASAGWSWKIARGVALDGDGMGGQVLDGFGGLHPFGNAPGLSCSGYWPGWDIARDVAVRRDGQGAYVMDAYGGLHTCGNAPGVSGGPYWPGWTIARGFVLRADGTSGYLLDGYGGVHPFGGAPGVATSGYWPGWDIARALVLRPDGVSGYVLDGFGGLHPFGGAPAVSISGYWPGWDIARSLTLNPDGVSGYVFDGFGSAHPFGGAPGVSVTDYPGTDVIRGASSA